MSTDSTRLPRQLDAADIELRPRGLVKYAAPIQFEAPEGDIPIGVVVPFDFALDWEYWRYLPPGVSLHFSRTPHLQRDDGMYLARACGKPSVVARTARTLRSLDPATVLYACTSGSFVDGVEGEAAIRSAMGEVGCRNPVTSSWAARLALEAAGARRVAVATPYSGALTQRLVDYLTEAGFDVVSANYLGLHRGIASVSQATIADLVRHAATSEAEAVFVSCTSLRTYGIVAELERELHVPVFTSNQVSLWAALVAAGALPRDPGLPGADWVLGDNHPMARSTAILMEAAATARQGAA